MIGGRLLRIGIGAAGLIVAAAVERSRGTTADGSQLPRRLRITLERLGPTFVKFGQTLSLHRAGPRVFGDAPVFALLGYALALWLSFRLVRAVARSGRL